MKQSLPIVALIGLGILGLSQVGISNSGGSPTGRSGSPASSNRTCLSSGCHSGGAASTQNITITSDIPATGFEENTNYTITISADANGGQGTRIGFAASVENAGGTHQGTLTSADGRTNVFNDFATHTSTSLSPTAGVNSWDLTWNSGTAEDQSTVYVAVNFANGNGTTSGDQVGTQTLVLDKASGIGVEEFTISDMKLYPNPAVEELHLDFSLASSNEVVYSIFGMDGREIMNKNEGLLGTGDHTLNVPVTELETGTYLIHIQAGDRVLAERFMVQ
ncbi:choice-of-anchor V domain-containing protein [Phaeocystidibacter luteus]|uniref:T9SS type A sorting domain-containing protein n=1 Tax=Phaeocystidibacter luteus TaxID=911197 RepID=A0A6N6RJ75_9FLAO|nr:choice-of-anchor V domain-containing protein [Phaeocystidibacter luteus]KAB2814036.1 T9SS type A sorting domain-containing protein [Phaeocystidibacter luteus]